MPELHALELNGFLNSIRCLIGCPSGDFVACFIPKSGEDIKSIVDKKINCISKSCRILKNEKIDFKTVSEIFRECIYKKLPTTPSDCIINLDWNLVEYYGLISTAENEHGPWNRLVGQKHSMLEFEDEKHQIFVTFFVDYDEFAIETFLIKSW